MEEVIISFESAKLLHEQRFCNGCYHYYDVKTKELVKNISGSGNLAVYINGLCDGLIEAPTQSLVQKWFREKTE